MATLIIVSGPSASGKSTVSHRLAQDLRVPVLTRDLIKEALFDSLGYSDRKRSIELGSAAALILLRQVEGFLNEGVSCIIEGKFNPKFSEEELKQLIKSTEAHALQIQCIGEGSTLLERFNQRVQTSQRHPGHDESNNLGDFKEELLAGRYPHLELGVEVVEYDTTKKMKHSIRNS